MRSLPNAPVKLPAKSLPSPISLILSFFSRALLPGGFRSVVFQEFQDLGVSGPSLQRLLENFDRGIELTQALQADGVDDGITGVFGALPESFLELGKSFLISLLPHQKQA